MQFRHLDIVNSQNSPLKLTIASGPVIIKENKVLLDMHDDPFWKFPGGSVESGQSFEQTAIREAKEELGLEVNLIGDPFTLAFDRETEGIKEYFILIHFKAEVISGEIVKGRGVNEINWFDINKLPDNIAPNVSQVVKFFFNG